MREISPKKIWVEKAMRGTERGEETIRGTERVKLILIQLIHHRAVSPSGILMCTHTHTHTGNLHRLDLFCCAAHQYKVRTSNDLSLIYGDQDGGGQCNEDSVWLGAISFNQI